MNKYNSHNESVRELLILSQDICSGSVEFEDVYFSYPTRPTAAVLRGLSMKVEQGHTIALVGASGCGKSTTVQLLERFYDVPKGRLVRS